MDLHLTPHIAGGLAGLERCERYLERMPLAAERRRELLQRVASHAGTGAAEAMTELQQALAGQPVDRENPCFDSVRTRLALAFGLPRTEAGPVIATDVQERPRLFTVPPFN
ncbi:MAG TPA: hypothetical protein VFG44_04185, partial [Burkholderiales bacterium]|nr:hypothetical protein [Burkholderiales bacterium]